MNTIIIEAKNKNDVKFWLELAKKTGTRAKSITIDDAEDIYLGMLIEEGLKTGDVNRESIMKALICV
jgi:hypothetical protein